mmetsp:Transcript_32546/g.71834  ORF Transcript_32546/g.71834 Transcript_32546/m.71834 type:complete len:208 (-) Transcript_32546:447-1070(-)
MSALASSPPSSNASADTATSPRVPRPSPARAYGSAGSQPRACGMSPCGPCVPGTPWPRAWACQLLRGRSSAAWPCSKEGSELTGTCWYLVPEAEGWVEAAALQPLLASGLEEAGPGAAGRLTRAGNQDAACRARFVEMAVMRKSDPARPQIPHSCLSGSKSRAALAGEVKVLRAREMMEALAVKRQGKTRDCRGAVGQRCSARWDPE